MHKYLVRHLANKSENCQTDQRDQKEGGGREDRHGELVADNAATKGGIKVCLHIFNLQEIRPDCNAPKGSGSDGGRGREAQTAPA